MANLESLEEVGQKRKALLRATREHRLRVRSTEVTKNREEENSDPGGLLTQDKGGLRRDLKTLLSLLDHVLKLDKSIHGIVEVLGESHRDVLLRRTVVTEGKVRLNVSVLHNRLDERGHNVVELDYGRAQDDRVGIVAAVFVFHPWHETERFLRVHEAEQLREVLANGNHVEKNNSIAR